MAGAVSGNGVQTATFTLTALELSGIVDTGFASGDRAYVRDLAPNGRFYLDRDSVAAADNITVIDTWSGFGRWLNEGAANTSGDKFAPRYIVGNVPAGDPATPQTGPFRYIPDPGDGTGLALAVAESSVNPGPIYVRPGTYDWDAGPLAGPLTVGDGVLIQGAGSGVTFLVGSTGADQGVLILAGLRCGLMDITVEGGRGGVVSASDSVILLSGPGARLENVRVIATLDPAHTLSNAIRVSVPAVPPPNDLEPFTPSRNVTIYCRQTPE